MRFCLSLAVLIVGVLTIPAVPAAADSLRVVATVAPVHSLVARVMAGVGEPSLLMGPGTSPHGFAIKPSQARQLHGADVVFWVGANLEAFLEKPLAGLAAQARVVELSRVEDLERLPSRPAGAWTHSEIGDGEDPHVWLDTRNAQAIVRAVVRALGDADPSHAENYAANGGRAVDDLVRLEADLLGQLASVADRPYVVFHDAFAYFEHRFGLHPVGAVTSTPDRRPGARRLADLRRIMAEAGAGCVFVEPQFKPALSETLVRGTGARLAALDPMGADLSPGPMLYNELMENLAKALLGCLTNTKEQ